MKLRIVFCVPLLLCFGNAHSQWFKMGNGIDYPGRCMIYDSVANVIVMGGEFDHAESIIVHHLALWDGIEWDSVGPGAPFGAPAYSLIQFQGNYYASSIFYNSHPNDNWLAKWDGQIWDTISPRVNGPIYVFKVFNNILYLGGSFSKVGTLDAPLIATFDGTSFTSFTLPALGNSINAIEFYQGNMYVGGNFYDTLSNVHDLEFYDGIEFKPFGGNGLAAGFDFVSSMAVYNNELYIGGSFSISTGSAGNNIMRWNGISLSDVGGGLDGRVQKLRAFPDGLYASGVFQFAGPISVSRIAKWDGANWHPVVPAFNNNGINDFLIINNDLYLTGSFITIDTLIVNNIVRYHMQPNNLDIIECTLLNIFPNPASDYLHIEGNNMIIDELKIIDVLGKVIYSNKILQTTSLLDVSFLKSGLYFLTVETKEGRVVKKFIKD